MIKLITYFSVTCAFACVAFALESQPIFLSSTHEKLNIVWSILPKALHVDGAINIGGKNVKVSVNSNEAILIGIPGCNANCTGILTQTDDNKIFLKAYKTNEQGMKVPMTFERSGFKKDQAGNIWIGSTDSDGVFISLLPIIQIDALYTPPEPTFCEQIIKQILSYHCEQPVGKTQIVLHFLNQPEWFSDRKF